jgi:hypothetical protein
VNLEDLPDQAVLLDASGQVVTVNRLWTEAAGRYQGLGVRPAPGESYLEALRGPDPSLLEAVESVLSGRATRATLEYSCFEELERRHFMALIWRLGEETVALHQDVTPAVSRRRRWAHEVNNSLTALMCYLSLGMPMLEPGSAAREHLVPAEEAARQLLDLVNQRPN